MLARRATGPPNIIRSADSSTLVTAFPTLGIGGPSSFRMLEAIQPQRRRQQNGKPQHYTLTYDRGRFIPFTISARLVLWTGKRYLAFRAEDIAIKARNPVPSARRHVEISYFRLNMGRYTVPIKLRVSIDDVGG
jgi:hypothetical protein